MMTLWGRVWAEVPGPSGLVERTYSCRRQGHFSSMHLCLHSPHIHPKQHCVSTSYTRHIEHAADRHTDISTPCHFFVFAFPSVLRHLLKSCLPETQTLQSGINLWETGEQKEEPMVKILPTPLGT